MPNDFERFGKAHPFLPSGWGPQSRADIPWNAPVLADVNPAAGIVSRLNSRFSLNDARGRMAGDGIDGEDGAAGADGLGQGLSSSGGGGSSLDPRASSRIAGINAILANQGMSYGAIQAGTSMLDLLKANGMDWDAMQAGTSLLQRLNNASGEGICNEDGTITITLTI